VTDQHPRPPLLNLVGKLDQQPGLAYPGIAGQQHQLGLLLLGPVKRRPKPPQLLGPADERSAREPPSHARQYGRGQRGRKRAGCLRRPAPWWGCHLRAHRSQHQLPPATRRPLAPTARRPSATYQTLVGGLLLTFGDALLGQHSGQSDMLVVHLALPSAVCLRAGRYG
jgi:hypothetical protein